MPLEELWRDDGFSSTARGVSLFADAVRVFLCRGSVHFVVADVGKSPQWIPPRESYHYWKREVESHLVAPESCSPLEEFPDNYLYFATLWGEDAGVPVILLEKRH
jgi:hypothetical protein